MRAKNSLIVVLTMSATLVLSGCSPSTDQHNDSTLKGGSASAAVLDRKVPADQWTRPDNQQAQVQAAGLPLASEEVVDVHYHAYLNIEVDGQEVPVPAELGINVGPNGKAPQHGDPGIAYLHTHDTSGILHVEAPKADEFTLGQIFDEWGIHLSQDQIGSYVTGKDDKTVLFYVNGALYKGDPNKIVLKDHENIYIWVGNQDDAKNIDLIPGFDWENSKY